MCHNRLIRLRRHTRKKKFFFAMHFSKEFGNINFLKTPKEAVLEISYNSVDRELVGINGIV